MISVHAHHLYFDLVSLLDTNSCFSNDLNNLFIEEGFPVLNRENNMVMNLPCTMVSFSNRAIRVHPLSITTNPCSKLQGTFKLERLSALCCCCSAQKHNSQTCFFYPKGVNYYT